MELLCAQQYCQAETGLSLSVPVKGNCYVPAYSNILNKCVLPTYSQKKCFTNFKLEKKKNLLADHFVFRNPVKKNLK